jgi:hypothetical protein
VKSDELERAIEELEPLVNVGYSDQADIVFAAARRELSRMREAEPIDEETASALRLWKEDHEATRDYHASLRIQELTAAAGTLDRLLREHDRTGEGQKALELLAEAASGAPLSPKPSSPPLEAIATLSLCLSQWEASIATGDSVTLKRLIAGMRALSELDAFVRGAGR